ncbi:MULTISPECIES: septal ring lytic transglycosylase RlpA family protein [Pseudomonas]|uniref:septal ring lytic transglycosylase RlpA family protein n=1 Tax=Pseudomonas TaxID=286 RepID=UPI0008EF9CA2|nr:MULTISPECIES: septal ring lytic transglycosylase RlpA family protein [Pseudomonas]NRH28665.1 septal ring lytic transglycosylase RlpA family protein [Pseudomonas sp. MS19]SFU12901.1 rare lipoprotein A [Pseudomonas marincola]
MSQRRYKLAAFAVTTLLVASCTSSRAPQPTAPSVSSGGGLSGPSDYNRPHRDGAPWWDVDISRIQDAVPTVHNGAYKASPYTVFGKKYFPLSDSTSYKAVGPASWYGTKFHGQATANGETYDLYAMSAAHKTLPLPSYVRVTNLENGKSVIVRVNDRGPFYSDRIIDLSFAAAKKLGYAEKGTAQVKVEGIDPEKWWAQQGKRAPSMMALPTQPSTPKTIAQVSAEPIEQYSPPVTQHAAATLPVEIDSKKNASVAASGLYLQVGAFANPDAAELLKDKLSTTVAAPVFISSVVQNQKILHRVRLGPISSPGEAEQMQDSIRLANLGQPRLVKPE